MPKESTVSIEFVDLRNNLPLSIDRLRKMSQETHRSVEERFNLSEVVTVLEQIAENGYELPTK